MHMGEAKVLQEEEDGGKWEGLNEEELKQKQDALKQAEGIARHFLGQTDKTIAFLAYVTERCAEPFLATVFVERMAVMLNSFIEKLAGAKVAEIKVRDMEALGFRPLDLLELTATVLTNLHSAKSPPPSATVEDGAAEWDGDPLRLPRAIVASGLYEARTYQKAVKVLHSRGKDKSIAAELSKLVEAVAAVAETTVEEDLDLDDCPDEFLDPLMATLMTDPVTLPCGNTIDRVTIERSLLDSEINPFSREPLTVADLVPNDALKKRIEDWANNRRRGGPA